MTANSTDNAPVTSIPSEIPDHLALEAGRAVLAFVRDAVTHYRRADAREEQNRIDAEARGYVLVDYDGGGHGDCPGAESCTVMNTITGYRTGEVLATHHDDYEEFAALLDANKWITADVAGEDHESIDPVPEDLPSAQALLALPFIQDGWAIMADDDEQMTATEKWFRR